MNLRRGGEEEASWNEVTFRWIRLYSYDCESNISGMAESVH